MKETFALFGAIILIFALVLGVAFGAPYLRLQVLRMYGTELESVKTDIYRENKSYVEGTVRDLRELQVDYQTADASQKEAVASLILHRANELDWDRLPSDVRQFLNELRGEK